MYTCILCDNPDEWTRGLCTKCEEIKKVISLYGVDKVTETLKYVYIREQEPIKARAENINKKSPKKVEIKKV